MQLSVLLVLSILSLESLNPSFRRIARIESGPLFEANGRVVCCDSDHDSLPELIFSTGTIHPSDPWRIEYWEHQGWNRFGLVYADTGQYPEPNGITIGNAIPYDAGDIDGDGLTDIACTNCEFFYPDSAFDIVMTLESPDFHSYPCSLSWYYRGPTNYAGGGPIYFTHDLDHDGHDEMLGFLDGLENCIWENVGDNQNELQWVDTLFGYNYVFRDFDCDGRSDIGTGWFRAKVLEATGDDRYELVWQDTERPANGYDVFSTADIDGDGRPEFYICYEEFAPRYTMWLYMYEDESDGNHIFTPTLVDSLRFTPTDWGHYSAGGDIDGDGIDECIWTTLDSVRVYKAYGNNDLHKVWDWRNDHHDTSGFNALTTTVYDVNGDGYNEFLLGGNMKVSIFEVDAVDLLSPNGGMYNVGDTISIRWATHSPPRCDSLSVFLRRDSSWLLDTIARGLPGTDTLCRWVVPSGAPDTGRVVVIAYGPGWQFDISDSVVTFTSGGVSEGTHNVPLQWALSVSPNPARGAFTVQYDVPGLGKWGLYRAESDVGAPRDCPHFPVPVRIGIYDAGGRLVRSLSEGAVAPGRYEARIPSGVLPAGIYFLRLDTPGFRSVKKAVVAR
jgi:hypothetical protein